jgi:hypothetical protein
LLAIDPAGKDHDEQLPRLKNKFHRRLDGQAKPTRSLEFTDKSSSMAQLDARWLRCCLRLTMRQVFSAADAHVMSAQMRTKGSLGIPFF